MFSTEFLITSLIVVLIPGTGVIYTVSNGLFLGWRASIAAAFGCTAGIIPHLVASILGLSAILHMSALAFQLFKFAGAAYLLYLAWAMWRERGSLNFDSPEAKKKIPPDNFKRLSSQYPQPKTLNFLPGFPAAFRISNCSIIIPASAGVERYVHGDNLGHFHTLRPLGKRCSQLCNQFSENIGYSTAFICSNICRSWSQACHVRSIKVYFSDWCGC